jgi:hypothetical protein
MAGSASGLALLAVAASLAVSRRCGLRGRTGSVMAVTMLEQPDRSSPSADAVHLF